MLKIDRHYREATIAIMDNISASTVTGAVIEVVLHHEITLVFAELVGVTFGLFWLGIFLRKKGEKNVA